MILFELAGVGFGLFVLGVVLYMLALFMVANIKEKENIVIKISNVFIALIAFAILVATSFFYIMSVNH